MSAHAGALRSGFGRGPSLIRLRRGRTAWAFVAAGLFGLASSYALPVAATIEPAGSDPLAALDAPRFAFPTFAAPEARSADPKTKGPGHPALPASSATAPGDTSLGTGDGGSRTTADEASGPASRTPDVATVPQTSQVPDEVVENRYATEALPKPAEEQGDPFAGLPIVENSYGMPPPLASDPVALGHAQPAPDPLDGPALESPAASPPRHSPSAGPRPYGRDPSGPAKSKGKPPAAKPKSKAPVSEAPGEGKTAKGNGLGNAGSGSRSSASRGGKGKPAASASASASRARPASVSSLSGAEMDEIVAAAAAPESPAPAPSSGPAQVASAPVEPAAAEAAPVASTPVEPGPVEAATAVEAAPATAVEPAAAQPVEPAPAPTVETDPVTVEPAAT
jgi:hypothetical protein